jgi:heat shock protein HtpX
VILFLALLNAAWILAAAAWLDRNEWLWITPFALSINFLLLAYDQVLTFSHLESRPIVGQDPWGLLKSVHRLSEQFAVRAPQVHLLDHPSAHIFSYAKTGRSTRLFVTKGLLDLLSPDEINAVLTFQMVAIQSSFTCLNYWVGAAIDLLLRVGNGAERAFAFVFGWTPPVKGWIIGPWIWLLQFMLVSPRDFQYLDSATAAKLPHAEDLARALWKMEAYAQTRPWGEPWVFSHMCMVSPLTAKPIFRMLTAQPNLKSRIKRLVGRYPL